MNDTKNLKRGLLIRFFVIVFLVFFDQLTKVVIVNRIGLNNAHSVIKGFFSLNCVGNTGVAFSLFNSLNHNRLILSLVAIVMTMIIIMLIILSVIKNANKISIALTLLVSGAIGNIIDRVRLSYVVDFLRFDFGKYTFPIFNFADICAVVGSIILLVIFIFDTKETDRFLSVFSDKKKRANDEGGKK